MNDDTLVLYYYDDGLSADERSAVAAALEKDAALRARYRELCRSLEQFDEPPPVQAPAHMVARWHRSIDRAAAARQKQGADRRWHLPSFAWGALAAGVVLAFTLRLWLVQEPTPVTLEPEETMAGDPSPAPATVPVSFSRGLKVHLRESRQGLLHLAEDGEVDRRLLLMDIMRQNRQFERAALDHNAEDVARVLRAFEPILMRLATEDISAEDAAALKSKLVFELNVMLTKIAAGESQDEQSI